jgi:hypothetical protein
MVTAGLVTERNISPKTLRSSDLVVFCSSAIRTPFDNSPYPSYYPSYPKRGIL